MSQLCREKTGPITEVMLFMLFYVGYRGAVSHSPRLGTTLHEMIPGHMFADRIWGDTALALEIWEIPGSSFLLLCITDMLPRLRNPLWKNSRDVMLSISVAVQYTTQHKREKPVEEVDFTCKLIPIFQILFAMYY